MSFRVESGFALRSHEGFQSCGDAVFQGTHEGVQFFAVVDALGHGPDAAFSAQRVCETLGRLKAPNLREAFLACDGALAGLREVVMATVRVDGSSARFGGIGNIEIIGPAHVGRPASQVGRVGRGLRSLREVELPIASGHRWVLASDGIRARELRAAMDASAPLSVTDAAQFILELAGRKDDDASVLVLDIAEVA